MRKNWQIKAALVIAAIQTSIIFSGSAQAATAEFNAGLTLYGQNNFAQALTYLNDAVMKEPGSAQAHYYFANALAQTNQHRRAIDEYRSCLALNPPATIAGYCLQALKAYSGRKSESVQSLHSSISRLRAQSRSLSTQILNDGRNRGNQVLAEGNAMANRAIARGNEDVRNLTGAIDGGNSVSFYGDPTYVANSMAQAGQIHADASQAASFAIKDSTRRMVEVRTSAKQISHALSDSTVGLISQMTRKGDGPTLDAAKSSLYTRTYSYTH